MTSSSIPVTPILSKGIFLKKTRKTLTEKLTQGGRVNTKVRISTVQKRYFIQNSIHNKKSLPNM